MRLIYSMFTLLILLGCSKDYDKPTKLVGSIKDFYSNEPVIDYELYLGRKKISFLSSPINIDTFWTDNSGYFSYSFYNEQGYLYNLIAGFDNSHAWFNDYYIQSHSTNNYEIFVKPYRVIELELINSTGKYKEFSVWPGILNKTQFIDTTIYINDILPEEEYTLVVNLYESSDDQHITMEEYFTINNVDTTYYRLEY